MAMEGAAAHPGTPLHLLVCYVALLGLWGLSQLVLVSDYTCGNRMLVHETYRDRPSLAVLLVRVR
jgi:hypothetical protein